MVLTHCSSIARLVPLHKELESLLTGRGHPAYIYTMCCIHTTLFYSHRFLHQYFTICPHNFFDTAVPKHHSQTMTDLPTSFCHVCCRMAGDDAVELNRSHPICLLCDRGFCPRHASRDDAAHGKKEEGVCEINHTTYYRNHGSLRGTIWPSMERREVELAATSKKASV